MNAAWKSQRFDAEGSTTATGILKQLGRPNLDEFTVLVREAAQNSWDARRGDVDVQFSIRLERIGEREGAWQRLLLPGPPAQSVPALDQAVGKDSWLLVISDRGTAGLSGPVRATQRPAPGERNDFVQFLRNVGEPRDTALGGGTYGFGKGIFYRTSSVRTILADTRIVGPGGLERRLFGASLGADFWGADGERYTGRHWWGVNSGGVVDPLIGDNADLVANDLGLPAFDGQETGTSVVVLGADLGLVRAEDELGFADPQALGAHLASAILWNLWPKFEAFKGDDVAMSFSVLVEGTPVVIPEPSSVAALRPFAKSLLSLGSPNARSYRRTAVPRIDAGDYAVTVGVAPQTETAVVSSARPFDGAPHHIARMRQAGLVVDYLDGPVHPDPLAAYGGVFRATGDADEYFAAAEPPTHDRWNPEGLDKLSRSVVEGARRWIRDDLSRRFIAPPTQQVADSSTGLGRGSRRLAGLVAGVHSTGADPVGAGPGGAGGGGGVGGAPMAPARAIGDPWIGEYMGQLAVLVRVRVDRADTLASVRGHLDVVLDGGGRESEAPRGVSSPQIVGWLAEGDSTIAQLGETLSEFGDVRDWIAIGEFSDSAVTRFRLELERVTDGT